MSEFDPNSKLVKIQNIEEERPEAVAQWAAPNPQPQKQEQPKVVPDVPAPEAIDAPSEESIRVEQKLIRLREEMGTYMKEFNSLFKDSVLPQNKSEEAKQKEADIFNKLITQFNLLNEISPDEGTVTLLVLCLRHLLSLRDAGNKLAYQVYLLEKSVFGEASEDKKRKEAIVKKQEKLQKMQEQLQKEYEELEG